ncbi:3-phosphoshikimate 1-carboxyvinyltransferase [Flavobacterium sp.]|uniref:3-phosphoshikimate 1-carboxyvinyltransferase n=1 Tax=Flavobacterium sp. TaxID=239 RepID=UPI0035285B7D
MNLKLQKSKITKHQLPIAISGSKSETNRLLLLQALFPEIQIENASISDDSEVMKNILWQSKTSNLKLQTFDVHHAGTAMRFLTAYFAQKENSEILLTGSSRMKERPIKILVDALRELGATIDYVENEGFPPLKIKGKKLIKNKVSLPANVSSQYISAVLLIAPKLENGIDLTLEGKITSLPYIKMTLELLNYFGVETEFINKRIKINSKFKIQNSKFVVESDWSSVSYWYSIIALSEIGTELTVANFKKSSLQGDALLTEIYEDFGVETIFNNNNSITITKTNDNYKNQKSLIYNLQSTPDIAQTIAVTCFGLGIKCTLTGLHTLKIKETDRLKALQVELTKLGATISITAYSLHLQPSGIIKENVAITTYQDHRMAMAFAPLAIKVPIIINNANVVSKSYPNFWNHLQQVGFTIQAQ